MEKQLYRLNPWWNERFESGAIERERYIEEIQSNLENDLILFLVGMRRVGKTTLMKSMIEKLQDQKILFVPLDHPVFINTSIMDIVEKFREINSISFKEKIYIFLDEIQAKEDFETDLKALVDNENIKIICSGSQSLLIKDKKAKLTGRVRTIFIDPLSFPEFLKFTDAKVDKADEHLYKSYFEEYLEIGGIPRYVLDRDPNYMIELVDSIITKDIVNYHNIKNPKLLKELFLLLCERVGKRVSFNKIANVLSTSVETVRQYISYMEEAFLIHVIYRHARTLNERIKSNRKVYISDVGLRNVMTGFKDKGSVFENLVYLKLKDKEPRYYFEDSKEVDFVFGDTALECKFKDDASLDNMNKVKGKKRMIVKDYRFFL